MVTCVQEKGVYYEPGVLYHIDMSGRQSGENDKEWIEATINRTDDGELLGVPLFIDANQIDELEDIDETDDTLLYRVEDHQLILDSR